MKIIKYLSLATLLTTALLTSCKHDNFEQLGPDYCSVIESPLSDSTKLIVGNAVLSSDSVDFYKNNFTINAKLSGNLEWHIKIKGRTSNAVKYYDSISANISQIWRGESDTNIFFVKNEMCDITFSSNCQASQTKTVYLKSYADYSKLGYLLDDFEGGGTALNFVTSSYTDSIYGGIINNPSLAAQGSKFSRLKGTAESWFFGSVTIPITANSIATKLGTSVASDIYLNLFVNNNDCATNKITLNTYLSGVGKKAYPITATKPGWNFVSIKLSDIIDKVDVSKITKFEFDPGPSLQYSAVDMSLDFIMLTKGKPLQ